MPKLDIAGLKKRIDSLRGVKTLVVGDLAIDEMMYGVASRI